MSYYENKIKDVYLSDGSKNKNDNLDKWPLRVAVCGKPHSKIVQLTNQMSEKHPLIILDFDSIIKESIDSFESKETVIHELTPEEATGKFEVIDKARIGKI